MISVLGYYKYWTLLTYIGIVSAVTGISFANCGSIKYAIICLMICGACDMFDGSVAKHAKRTDRERNFGIQIDSLADVVCFGVFPAIIGYTVCADYMENALGKFGIAVTLAVMSIYVLAALIRLGYFNAIEIELQSKKEKRIYYEGLPVTTVGLILPVVYSVCSFFGFQLPPVYGVFLIIISVAFLFKVKLPKLKMRYMICMCIIGLPFFLYIFFSRGI